MTKSILLLTATTLILSAYTPLKYDLENKCKDVKVTDFEFGYYNENFDKTLGVSYGFKNISDNKIDNLKVKVYLLDSNNKPIYDKTINVDTIKPNYELPKPDSTFYNIGDGQFKTFSGKGKIIISCENKNNSNININSNLNNNTNKNIVKIDLSKFKDLKAGNAFEAQVKIAILLRVVEKYGGIDKFLETITPCLKKK